MTQQHPKDPLQADLEALAEVFEAEDREDRRAEAQRRREGLPEPSGRSTASPAVERLLAPERLLLSRYLCATHASSKSTLTTAYSARSRSRSGTRWVRLSVARLAASKTAMISSCWLVALMRLECSQAQRQSTGVLSRSGWCSAYCGGGLAVAAHHVGVRCVTEVSSRVREKQSDLRSHSEITPSCVSHVNCGRSMLHGLILSLDSCVSLHGQWTDARRSCDPPHFCTGAGVSRHRPRAAPR